MKAMRISLGITGAMNSHLRALATANKSLVLVRDAKETLINKVFRKWPAISTHNYSMKTKTAHQVLQRSWNC